MPKSVLVLYPNQLFTADKLPKDLDQVLVVEDPTYFGRDPQNPLYLHKQKLVFMRATMRRYIEEVLWPAGYQVDYVELNQLQTSGDIVNKLSHFEHIMYFDLNNDQMNNNLQEAIGGLQTNPAVDILETPNFYLTRLEISDFLAAKNKSDFATFYRWQRERFNILINPETYKPVGGKLSYENDTHKRLPKNHKLPTFQVYGSNPFVAEAKEYVQANFTDNPGLIDDFPWPTSRQEATAWLDEFIEHRLDSYSEYEDAIDGVAPWVYHSGLSPLLNCGLLHPSEVVNLALEKHAKKPVPIESLESFVRQILGWREYVRGVYNKRHVQLRTVNTYGHNRMLTADWYRGTTGIPPVDDVIHKVLTRGYAHHTERLMIMGNMMFLCDFHPDEVYRWFREMFVDSYDWVVVPNVYGMSQYSDSSLVTKPYISSSNYILKMSHYERGDWCDVWDGLYWRFIEKNRDRFEKNANMKAAVKQLDKLNENQKRIISYRAEDFLKEKTAP